MRKPRSLLLDGVLTVLFLGLVWLAADRISRQGDATLSGVPRVVDGDTLALGRDRIRLAGIDAPELSQNCERDGKTWACGQEARRHLIQLIGGLPIACKGGADDRYGRRLAACRTGGEEVNARMVNDGFAVAFGDYAAEEAVARARRSGLWAGSFDQPRDWRARHGRTSETPHIDGDWIKALLRHLETAWTSR
ncbi:MULTISPECIES: thermonuclease family protein [unclassified Rhizobium]|uniref:thermonuclease family protein n=1 Tax=unclassified Rhizobium TaxID=2613769 RepID=UPI000A7463AB|nr:MULTISPECIES: thermonuclease family protein [unclassified Rhizobium]